MYKCQVVLALNVFFRNQQFTHSNIILRVFVNIEQVKKRVASSDVQLPVFILNQSNVNDFAP